MTTKIATLYGKKYFVVETGINKSAYRKGITSLKVKDEDGNDVFMMSIALTAESGEITDFSITVNGVDDGGNYVVMIPICEDIEAEDLKRAYGAKLVKASEYVEKLKVQMATEAQAIDGIFAGINQ